jgi:cytochrome oxidase assembly protein ShyY1
VTTTAPAPSYLRSGRWVPIVIFAIVMSIACVLLARWQWSRLDDRRAANAVINTNEGRPAVGPSELAPAGAEAPRGDVQWRLVRATGTYVGEGQRLVRQRSLNGGNGYFVLTPLATLTPQRTEAVLWVARGWIPAGPDARTPSTVPEPPAGEVTVTGRARPWEPPVDESGLPPSQIQRIGPTALTPAVEGPSYPFWIQAAAEAPSPAEVPQRLPEPKLSEGPHLGYAIQWVMFALGALIGGMILIRRQREYFAEDQEALAQQEQASPVDEGD